jgi:vacuolar-type H+-ATPase subunit E/Vma4
MGMAEEKTLLEQVHSKEVALAAEYARASVEAEAATEGAEREAREAVERAEEEGRDAAGALYRQEMDGLDREIERMRVDARVEEDALRSIGESRVSEVVDELVGYVAPE